MEVALRILPFFALVGVGAAAVRVRAFDAATVAGLSRYVYWVGFPALLIHALAAAPPPGLSEVRGLAAYACALALPYLTAEVLARAARWPREVRAALPLVAGAQNDAFLAAPLTLAVFGPAVASHTGPMIALNWVLLIPTGVALLHRGARGGSASAAVRGALLNPVTAAAALGSALMLLVPHRVGVASWPAPVETVMAALAASSTPLALAAVGGVTALEGVGPRPGERAPIAAALALRLLLAPAAAWLFTGWVGAPAEFRTAAVVLAAGPTAVTAFIQAQAYSAFGRGAAQSVVISALASAVTLTLLVVMLKAR